MKKVSLLLFMAMISWSITRAQNELFSTKLREEGVPPQIVQSVAKDFPGLTISEYASIPVSIIEDNLYIYSGDPMMNPDFDTYMVTLESKRGQIRATYDRNGKLISKSENLIDVPLPKSVEATIGKEFPGWVVARDHLLLTSVKGNKPKSHYRIKLTKDNKQHYVVIGEDGKLIHRNDPFMHHDKKNL
ncbi:MAG: hypothetical protein KDC80_22410 [Saprospiraceae bacterium]|nr:hypothetical protein [Saprospiraceae bacterium]